MTLAYAYRCANASGTIEAGEIEAVDRDAASASLKARGLFVVELTERRSFQVRRISTADQALTVRTLATLLASGLPVQRSLAIVEDLGEPTVSRVVSGAMQELREGQTLASALETAGLSLPREVSGMLEAHEANGTLHIGCATAAELLEARQQFSASLRQAIAYPIVLLIVGGISTAVILGAVLPRFSETIVEAGAAVPRLTAILLSASRMAPALGIGVVVLVIAIALVLRSVRTDAGKRVQLDEWLLRVPMLGHLRAQTASARVSDALGALLGTGVSMSRALERAAPAAGDEAIAQRVLAARELVTGGASLSTAVASTAAMTRSCLRFIRAGEESGSLPEMLGRAAAFERHRSISRIRFLVRLIEPALIVTFAAIVALVAVALLQAVYAVRPL